ncbi:MAG: hypothetical protein EBS51_07640 [Planctomycetia bacterium]|nr:hypothetical protein [Planctomycetia bacterium]
MRRLRLARAVHVAVVATVMPLVALAAPPPQPSLLEFHRVHVPGERIGEVSLGPVRYVPMPLAEFDVAVARVEAARGREPASQPSPLVDTARYDIQIDERGGLVGTLVVTVAAGTTAVSSALPLGAFPAHASIARVIGPGGGDGLVFASTDGRFALRVSEPGASTASFSCRPVVEGAARYRVPLVPALASDIRLRLPADLRPLVSEEAARHAVLRGPDDADADWRIELGPVTDAVLTIRPVDRGFTGVGLWSEHVIRGSETAVEAVIEPAASWSGAAIEFDHDPGLVVTAVEVVGSGEPLEFRSTGRGTVSIAVPARLEGRETPLLLSGIAPASGRARRLPLVRPSAQRWVRGGMLVVVDPVLAVTGFDVEDSRVVSPQAAQGWPLPSRITSRATESRRPAMFHVEEQGPAAIVTLDVAPRTPALEVARVTTVEISSGAVLGRAACDLRVLDGEVFDVSARIAPGWIIDAVDLVEWPVAGAAEGGVARPPAAGDAVDWRVVRSETESALRVGLAVGATANRGLGLRVSGHRAGIPPGAPFTTADIDMVRFDGELADTAVLDFRTVPDAVVEIAGEPVGWFPVDARLARLVEDGTLRGRIVAGDQAPNRPARVVRRRPPLDARVEARLDVRDETLLETFSLTCRAEAGGIDALVVHFSEPMDDGLEWVVTSPPGIVATARRLDPADARRPGGSLEGVAESWLVECAPSIAGQARIRASRGVPFVGAVPVPLAWVESARRPGGSVVVSASGPARPRVRRPARGAGGRIRLRASHGVAGRAGRGRRGTGRGDRRPCLGLGRARALLVPRVGRDGVRVDVRDRESRPRGDRARRAVRAGRGGHRDRRHDRADRCGGCRRRNPADRTAGLPTTRRAVRAHARPSRSDARHLARPAGRVHHRRARARQACRASRASGPRGGAVGGRIPAQRCRFTRMDGATARGTAQVVVGGCRRDRGVSPGERRVPRNAVRGRCRADRCGGHRHHEPATGAVDGRRRGRARRHDDARDGRPTPPRGRRDLPRTRRADAVDTAAVRAGGAGPATTQVFITRSGRDEMALVPEPLFRLLADSASSGGAARVAGCRVLVPEADESSPWKIVVDLDSDIGATLVLDQTADGGAWLPPREADLPPGILARVDGRRMRLTSAVAGRHRVALEVVPAVRREGGVSTAVAGIPVAPTATVQLVDALEAPVRTAPGSILCERAAADGPFLSTPEAAAGLGEASFDVAGATRVRMVRPLDRRDRLATRVEVQDAVNDLTWEGDGCRLDATFDVDGGGAIMRSLLVRADERLVDLSGESGTVPVSLEPLEAGRWLVRFPEPLRGRVVLGVRARMPLADPVGIFDVPVVMLEATGADRPMVRLSSAQEFDAVLDVPATATGPASDAGARLPQRVTVRRRPQLPRGVQTLSVDFAADRVGLALRAQVEATATALVRLSLRVPPTCVIDRLRLTDEDASSAVDLVWSRSADDRVTAIVQRPRAGRFRLEVDGRVPSAPDPEGPLPLLRADVAGGAPLLVAWRAEPPGRLLVPASSSADASAERAGTLEIADTDPVVAYRYLPDPEGARRASTRGSGDRGPDERRPDDVADEPRVEDRGADGAAPVASQDADRGARVEGVEVFMTLDGHGRARGLARFDVETAEPVVRFVLPARARPYDVLVDGVEATAVPRDSDVWEVALHDVGWPRSVLVLFARDFGARVATGQPLEITPPAVLGMQAREVVWTFRAPHGSTLRFFGPSLQAGASAVERVRAARRETLADRFDEALGRLGPERHERLDALAKVRREGRALPLETAWQDAVGWRAAAEETDQVVEVGDAPLTVRVVRSTEASTPERVIATAALLAVFTLGSLALALVPATRSARSRARRSLVVWPLVGLAGVAWMALLAPVWPGAVLVVAAVAAWSDGGGTRRRPLSGVGAGDSTALLNTAR